VNASAPQSPWWRGTRGEWYVAAQVVLAAIVFFGPRTLPGLPAWPAPVAYLSVLGGGLLMAVGGALAFAGLFRLGANLTPLPYPKERATLIQSGPYALVRHPIYAGGILVSYGWALVVRGWLTLGYATVLLIFFEIKAAREERWLVEKFPEYPEYRRRVRKLIPFIR
jgi:protein-S-isoprenylcysteine O-methyltransferase Ste14